MAFKAVVGENPTKIWMVPEKYSIHIPHLKQPFILSVAITSVHSFRTFEAAGGGVWFTNLTLKPICSIEPFRRRFNRSDFVHVSFDSNSRAKSRRKKIVNYSKAIRSLRIVRTGASGKSAELGRRVSLQEANEMRNVFRFTAQHHLTTLIASCRVRVLEG